MELYICKESVFGRKEYRRVVKFDASFYQNCYHSVIGVLATTGFYFTGHIVDFAKGLITGEGYASLPSSWKIPAIAVSALTFTGMAYGLCYAGRTRTQDVSSRGVDVEMEVCSGAYKSARLPAIKSICSYIINITGCGDAESYANNDFNLYLKPVYNGWSISYTGAQRPKSLKAAKRYCCNVILLDSNNNFMSFQVPKAGLESAFQEKNQASLYAYLASKEVRPDGSISLMRHS